MSELAESGAEPVAPAVEGEVVTGDFNPAGSATTGGGESLSENHNDGRWYDVFGDDAKNLEQYKSPQDFLKTFNEAQRYMGQSIRVPTESAGQEQLDKFYDRLTGIDGVARLPSEGAPEEQVNAFWQKLGTPVEPTNYRLTPAEGAEIVPEAEQAFRSAAHKSKLTNAQAEMMYDWMSSNVANEEKVAKDYVLAEDAKLRSEWGEAYEHNTAIANGAYRELASEEFVEFLEETGLAMHPQMIKMFANLGKMMGEPQTDHEDSPSYKSPSDLQAEIDDLRARPEFWQDGTKEQRELVDKVNELTRRKLAVK